MVHALLLAVSIQADPGGGGGNFAPLARYLDESIARGAFPGAVVAIGRRDTVLYHAALGRTRYDGGAAVTTGTVYDLASLTKVVGLTTGIMMLVDDGVVRLDAPVRGYVRMFGSTHDSTITVRHLLTHSSGLPAWKPYFQAVGQGDRGTGGRGRLGNTAQREAVFDLAAREPLEQPTGTRMVYSDVGAINLTRMVELLTGERLDRYLRRRLFEPLGMRATRFVPPRSWRTRIAPTEVDNTYRRRLVHGEVHDENAFAMGGVSGHAGLFGTAQDLARFAQMMLRGGTTDRRTDGQSDEHDVPRLLRAETIAEFTRVQEPALSHRALGWETPNGQNSAGNRLTAQAFGHTGFTGVSLWIDPGQDLFVILLTNRVHPTRESPLIFEVRRRVADLAVELSGTP
jgi:CubicO group peptidase (beta-lactamase class C family)